MKNSSSLPGEWALILGASSGFGEATARELAKRGMNIVGVHLDRKSTLPNVLAIQKAIRDEGGESLFFNVNAADEENRKEVVHKIQETMKPSGKKIRTILHSLAFGTLKPYIAPRSEETLNKSQMEMTLDVMANSLVYWVQDLYYAGLISKGSHIFAMTSEGSSHMWKAYGAVSAAKAALESHLRQLAVELATEGVTANAILAGVTDTPALRKIPGHPDMISGSMRRNPTGRLTTPKDVAHAIALLSENDSYWISGNVIRVDGGECIVS